LYQNAPILLLDEPTSHLDPENEQALRGALDELVKDRTVLLIAHRLSTVRSCERAVVLERGRAVEEGRPEDLLSAAGRFAELFAEDLWRDRAERRSLA
jgi:ABC-type multidrug transport system fused ATPase/permease subunit